MRYLLLLLYVSQLVIGICFAFVPGSNDHAISNALYHYADNPTLQNKAELARQREWRKSTFDHQSFFFGAALIANLACLWYVWKRVRSGPSFRVSATLLKLFGVMVFLIQIILLLGLVGPRFVHKKSWGSVISIRSKNPTEENKRQYETEKQFRKMEDDRESFNLGFLFLFNLSGLVFIVRASDKTEKEKGFITTT